MLIEIPDKLLRTRMNLHLRKNLNGSFTLSAAPNNNARRGLHTTVSCHGNDLQQIVMECAERVDKAILACEIIL